MNKQSQLLEMKITENEAALLKCATSYAVEYLEQLSEMPPFPSEESLEKCSLFEELLPEHSCEASQVINLLGEHGSKMTVAHTGGRYFGFVCGGVLPVALSARWIADTWDQNNALYAMSPIASVLENLCERWLVELLHLPNHTAAGMVGGSSVAIITALTAARNAILLKTGWDVHLRGLFGAPRLRVIIGEQAHSSVLKALSMIGIGVDMIERVPVDEQGRMRLECMRLPDANTLIVVQAGNVNSGSFDPIDEICQIAEKVGAWVHVDGASGLWAAASRRTKYLCKGIERANSWSTDAHKTLNAPYDSGIVFCKDRDQLVRAMQASGAYIEYSSARDNMLYTPEMSRRARSIELWAILKTLGREGVEALVDQLCHMATYFSERLSDVGFIIGNEVVFNQIIVQCESQATTIATLEGIKKSGVCWCGGTTWFGKPAIRVSVSSWRTDEEAIDLCVDAFISARECARRNSSK